MTLLSRAPLALAALAALLASSSSLRAYDFTGRSWPDGDIPMVLALGAPSGQALMDGAADFNAVAESALQEWNQHLTRSRFTWTRNLDTPRARSNRINNVFFALDVYGQAFGQNVLAVALSQTSATTGRSVESDVIFNSTGTWNSYRGPLRPNIREFRRVALHEFGHVLGLDHPDEASPPQTVSAVMNSRASDVEGLQADDIAGAKVLYDPNSGVTPSIVAHPQSRTVRVGESYTLAVTATGSGPFEYTWAFTPQGSTTTEPFTLADGASYTIGSVQPADAGRYTVAVSSPSGFVVSNTATLSVTPISTSTDTTLANISTRAFVGRDSSVMIAGLVVGGTTPKQVFVRAAGPALADFGVAGALQNPTLSIRNSSGQTVAGNDDWESGGNTAAIRAAESRLGAFQFKAGSRDAALVATLPPGSYTAVVSGVNNTTGIALVEAYDADPDAATARTRKLVNIATRGQVNSGDDVLIAGLNVSGPGPRTYLIRAIGPTLRRSFGVSDALLDPFLQIYQSENLLRENDDWDLPASGMNALREAATKVGAFSMMETRDTALRSGLDAAMLITLQPGSYTAKVTGFEGRTGVALIEIYEVP
jgi:hypothetical protein